MPNSQRLNRGNHVMTEVGLLVHYPSCSPLSVLGQLVEVCRTNDVTDLVIVHEHRGEPGARTAFSSTAAILVPSFGADCP